MWGFFFQFEYFSPTFQVIEPEEVLKTANLFLYKTSLNKRNRQDIRRRSSFPSACPAY